MTASIKSVGSYTVGLFAVPPTGVATSDRGSVCVWTASNVECSGPFLKGDVVTIDAAAVSVGSGLWGVGLTY